MNNTVQLQFYYVNDQHCQSLFLSINEMSQATGLRALLSYQKSHDPCHQCIYKCLQRQFPLKVLATALNRAYRHPVTIPDKCFKPDTVNPARI
jgi:hypothetical protein